MSARLQFGVASGGCRTAVSGALPPFGVLFGALDIAQGGDPGLDDLAVSLAELALAVGPGCRQQGLPGGVLGLLDKVGAYAAVDLPHHGRVPECDAFLVFAGGSG